MKSLSVIILLLSIMACSEEPSHADCEKLKKNSDQAQAAYIDYQKLYDPAWSDEQKDQYKKTLSELRDAYVAAEKEYSSKCD